MEPLDIIWIVQRKNPDLSKVLPETWICRAIQIIEKRIQNKTNKKRLASPRKIRLIILKITFLVINRTEYIFNTQNSTQQNIAAMQANQVCVSNLQDEAKKKHFTKFMIFFPFFYIRSVEFPLVLPNKTRSPLDYFLILTNNSSPI